MVKTSLVKCSSKEKLLRVAEFVNGLLIDIGVFNTGSNKTSWLLLESTDENKNTIADTMVVKNVKAGVELSCQKVYIKGVNSTILSRVNVCFNCDGEEIMETFHV